MSLRWMVVGIGLAFGLACAAGAPPDQVAEAPPEPAPKPAPEPAPPASDAAHGPKAVIREVYAAYAEGAPAAAGPSWLPFAAEDLARSWRLAVETSRDGCGVPAIYESDPVIDAQDYKIERLRVKVRPDGVRAAATASFENFGKPTEVRFDLVREGGAWRIDDVHPSGDSLRARIRQTLDSGDGC